MGPRSDFSKPCQGAAEKSANATRCCCLARGFQRVGMSTVEAVNRKISWLFCFSGRGCTDLQRLPSPAESTGQVLPRLIARRGCLSDGAVDVAPMGRRTFLRMNIFRVHIVLKVIQTVGRNDAEDLFPYAASRFCITIDDALVDCLMRSFRHCIHTSQ